ncbi:2-keto-4-pentenoate hydratase [Paenisporosarcina sp. OV554]|uniref:2-keto-4-pentenoate hydratase n=1 Tax=Paenisporosarcina sp. OV554 TaxID=2135694 RepID=UPI000D39C7FF|nr:fumarylacetoacetate hydrolase family protein [Paenisporosarcina sp. OV554]PUB11674.1 2-oxo-3-hexenedioate decarboxylase [Paenisporosarcina sp. OV554]
MTLLKDKEKSIIDYLYNAERDVKEVIKVTDEYPTLTIKEAYELQDGLLARKRAESGSKLIGVKLGLTSKAKQEMMGVNEAIYGYLHSDMLSFEWEAVAFSDLIHPKIEPEIAFLMAEDLQGINISAEDVINATKYVAPALEIIDSRYKDFRFTLVDVVADNCSSAKFLVGSNWVSPNSIDLSNIGMVMSKNGKVEQTGSSAAVLGNPATAIAWAVNELGALGKGLKKGDIILSGAMSEAIAFNRGDSVIAEFDGLGSVSMYSK